MNEAQEQEVMAALQSAQQVGILKGKLEERERSRDELKGLLDAMQDELDLMRERAVRAETEVRLYKISLQQVDGLKL